MNFLAHLYLSGNRTKIMVGNFIGDFVKGRNLHDRYEPEIVAGIEMHRAIDLFTDSHSTVTQSKNRLRPKYRHYSGVIVDVFYDHFLARNWDTYHKELLPDFARRTYTLIQEHAAILPEDVKHMLPYMIQGNWLVNYARVEGIHRALSGMASRTPYESKMNEATADLEASYEEFKKEFEIFFPQLKEWAKQWLLEHPHENFETK
jgi:acyl carrier protein phosphodiesterase